MADTKKKTSTPGSKTHLKHAVLLDLEHVAADGHQALYETLKKVLSARKVDFPPHEFSRHCIDTAIGRFMPKLMKPASGKNGADEKLFEEICDAVAQAVTSDTTGNTADLSKLVRAIGERGVLVGAVTGLKNEAAAALAAKIGVSPGGLLVYSPLQKSCASADLWLKLAKQIAVSPALCVALTSSSASCKAALAAGMRPVVVPDKFTAFQDFGGANRVVDTIADMDIDDIFALLGMEK